MEKKIVAGIPLEGWYPELVDHYLLCVTLGQVEATFTIPDCTREGTSNVAEELAFEKLAR